MAPKNIRARLSAKKIQHLYNYLSSAYDLVTWYERESRDKALEVANPRENFVILDVGSGTGKTLFALANHVAEGGGVYGLDISNCMLGKSRRMLASRHLMGRVHLVHSDAARIPFRDACFDLILSSYMLDLIDTPVIPKVLLEFKRLLKPAGRLVLVSLTRGSKWYDNMKLYECVYRHLPVLLGGCRPVVLKPYLERLGFGDVTRCFMHAGHLMLTEIVRANKAS